VVGPLPDRARGARRRGGVTDDEQQAAAVGVTAALGGLAALGLGVGLGVLLSRHAQPTPSVLDPVLVSRLSRALEPRVAALLTPAQAYQAPDFARSFALDALEVLGRPLSHRERGRLLDGRRV
jgi:hypothetical protein